MASVSIDKVTKVYPGNVTALQESSLEIKDKEFMVVVGPSGCGKSSTLRMIAGLEDITKGVIKIDEKIVNHVHPKDRNVAMVFQDLGLYPHMTVYNNIAFGLKLRKVSKNAIEEKVKKAAESLGLSDYLKRKPKALSGGQRQRVALGRAIVREPSVFLFDEPLSNLDAKMRVEMRKELSLLHRRLEATIIYVTHDQTEAMTLGDRICVMSEGKIQQVGTPLEVYDRPNNIFVAKFIGTPAMNILSGVFNEKQFNDGELQFNIDKRTKNLSKGNGYLGIRPEHIRLDNKNATNEKPFHAQAMVENIEKLGDVQLIYCSSENNRFVCKAEAHLNIDYNKTYAFTFDQTQIHVFDSEGHNITEY